MLIYQVRRKTPSLGRGGCQGYYRQLSEEFLIREARVNLYFMETLYGIATVRMQDLTERRSSHWINLKIDAINTGISVTKMNLFFAGINTFIAACDQMVILWLGASLVIDNQMTTGMFVAFGAFRGQFSGRVASLTSFLLQLRMLSLHNERVADIALNEREAKKPDIHYEARIRPLSLETHADESIVWTVCAGFWQGDHRWCRYPTFGDKQLSAYDRVRDAG